MINQHQFQQSAKHYRSGRISLSEFQSRVFEGLEKNHQQIQQGNTNEILAGILDQLQETGQPAVVTGVSSELGQQLSQQVAGGVFDSEAKTFACDNGNAQDAPNDNLAVLVVTNIDAKFTTGYVAAIVKEE
jgi:NCAIR mutase (PurE)-related protein